jgi:hypothetical protein
MKLYYEHPAGQAFIRRSLLKFCHAAALKNIRTTIVKFEVINRFCESSSVHYAIPHT